MAANSDAMANFRTNVMRIVAETEGLSISALVVAMNKQRKKRRQPEVSRTFVSYLLNGHKDCSVPFAEEIATALSVPLGELLSTPGKNLAHTA